MLPRPEELMARIGALLDREPLSPWCVHRLCDQLVEDHRDDRTEDLLFETRRAADLLVATGRARRETVNAISIGAHGQDSVYWSPRSPHTELEQFGPEYASPRLLQRLSAHVECHGL